MKAAIYLRVGNSKQLTLRHEAEDVRELIQAVDREGRESYCCAENDIGGHTNSLVCPSKISKASSSL